MASSACPRYRRYSTWLTLDGRICRRLRLLLLLVCSRRRRRCPCLSADSLDVAYFAAHVACLLPVIALRLRVSRSSAALAVGACEGLWLRYPRTRRPSPCPLLLLLCFLVLEILVRVVRVVVRRSTIWHHQRLRHLVTCGLHPCIPCWHIS